MKALQIANPIANTGLMLPANTTQQSYDRITVQGQTTPTQAGTLSMPVTAQQTSGIDMSSMMNLMITMMIVVMMMKMMTGAMGSMNS